MKDSLNYAAYALFPVAVKVRIDANNTASIIRSHSVSAVLVLTFPSLFHTNFEVLLCPTFQFKAIFHIIQ